MSSDSSNDSGRWLGGIELGDESDAESAEEDNIGPVSVSTGTFPYTLKHLVQARSALIQDAPPSDAAKPGVPQRLDRLECHQLNVHADQSKVRPRAF